ncbi:MAG TPA: SemiSWEET transporter [Alphaproteobacteria bacterium]|jgi:MtN3 and saliva related transmembrane protein|nr:SemiSWEET transporter [Alphaproteobacteria bacterium]
MSGVSLIGYAAAVLTTIAFVPQAVRAWTTRSTGDISLSMFVMLTVGIVLWFVYGVLNRDWPLMTANFVTGLLAGSILYCKIRHK